RRKPSRKGSRLTEVPPELNDPHARIARRQRGQELNRPVAAPVVNQDQLVRASPPLEHLGELRIQPIEIRRLVVEREADGEGEHRHYPTPFAAGGARARPRRPRWRRSPPSRPTAAPCSV